MRTLFFLLSFKLTLCTHTNTNTAHTQTQTLLDTLKVDVEDVGAEIEVGDKMVVFVCAHGPTRLVRVALASSQV